MTEPKPLLSRNLAGVLSLCLGVMIFSLQDAIIKAVSGDYPLTQVVSIRCIVSAPILLLAAPFFGPLIRDLHPLHIVGLLFQSSIVVAGGFIAWLWLLSVYPASTVASFSFLTPILALLLGSLLFGETIGPAILLAAALAAAGIVLINRPATPRH